MCEGEGVTRAAAVIFETVCPARPLGHKQTERERERKKERGGRGTKKKKRKKDYDWNPTCWGQGVSVCVSPSEGRLLRLALVCGDCCWDTHSHGLGASVETGAFTPLRATDRLRLD